ncbi:MAG: efflux RND transporter periplasmic adaptor subunit [Geopsychrobacter sp.]|nr:efflux RND transporter periplasmic adaptor subunit [Geopsychrobacter sp.]
MWKTIFILVMGLTIGLPVLAVAGEHGKSSQAEEGHGEEHDEGVVRLTDAEMKEFGILVKQAGPGRLNVYVDLPGEIVINADRLAHVVPRVPGIVREVRNKLGDQVVEGDVMAVLESRELADTKAEYLASRERLVLAQSNFKREERLWKKKVSAEQEYLDAKQGLAEVRINLRSAEQKLHALGFAESYLAQLPEHPDKTYTRYEMTAPFAGAVIQKHISLGEALSDSSEAFVVADLSTVWVDINVYQKDLIKVRQGQKVVIEIGHGFEPVNGVLSYVGPLVGEETRTALARAILPNPAGKLRPGMFITARVATDSSDVAMLVPKTALQVLEGQTVVFVLDEDGFEPRPVVVGKKNGLQVEIKSGLQQGERYAYTGAFTLKAQLSKGAFGGGHGH